MAVASPAVFRALQVLSAPWVGDRPRILPTSAEAADEVNEQDKVDLAPCPVGTGIQIPNVPMSLVHPRTQVLP